MKRFGSLFEASTNSSRSTSDGAAPHFSPAHLQEIIFRISTSFSSQAVACFVPSLHAALQDLGVVRLLPPILLPSHTHFSAPSQQHRSFSPPIPSQGFHMKHLEVEEGTEGQGIRRNAPAAARLLLFGLLFLEARPASTHELTKPNQRKNPRGSLSI